MKEVTSSENTKVMAEGLYYYIGKNGRSMTEPIGEFAYIQMGGDPDEKTGRENPGCTVQDLLLIAVDHLKETQIRREHTLSIKNLGLVLKGMKG